MRSSLLTGIIFATALSLSACSKQSEANAVAAAKQGTSTDEPRNVPQLADYATFTLSEEARASVLSADFQSCLASTPNTSDYSVCSQKETERLDALLTTAAEKHAAALPGDTERQGFRADQEAWAKGRNGYCDDKLKREDALEGGSIDIMIRGNCVIDESVRRLQWLESGS